MKLLNKKVKESYVCCFKRFVSTLRKLILELQSRSNTFTYHVCWPTTVFVPLVLFLNIDIFKMTLDSELVVSAGIVCMSNLLLLGLHFATEWACN